jgi:hypothetical protein
MGLWSFDGPMAPPSWIGEYADTSRRLIRLGHIAFIGLGILDILLANELTRSPRSAPAFTRVAADGGRQPDCRWRFHRGGVAAFRYVMGVPATCVRGDGACGAGGCP